MSFLSSIFKKKKPKSDRFEVLDVADYKASVIGKDVQLVDVRTAREYRSGHLGNAKNIDFYQNRKFLKEFETFNKKKPIYLYCRSGKRSEKAARILIDMGFTKVYDLKGGILNWR